MKKLKSNSLLILLLCLVVTLTVALSSCNIVGGGKETPTDCQHELTAVAEVKATCTEAGTEGYYTCSGCDKLFADAGGRVEINAPKSTEKLGHSFTSYASDNNATCAADGTKTAKCDRCDVTSIVIEEGTRKAHSFTIYESDNNATYSKDGTKTAKCDNCTAEDTITDVDSKYTLFHEEYMAQVASYGSTQGPSSNKRMKISFSIPMQAGTKITFLGDSNVYMHTVVRTNNPADITADDAYAVDPGWLDDAVFVMPEPDEGKDAEYPVLIVRRVDNAELTKDELATLHTMFAVEGKRAVATNDSGALTEEEYNRQFAHWGSVPGPVQTTRQRISFAIKMNIGTVIKFIGDTDVYRWAVVETFNTFATSGTLDSGWNNKWTNPTADYVTKLNGSYPVLTICRVFY